MTVREDHPTVVAPDGRFRLPRRSVIAPALAALWSLTYLGLGVAWLLGAGGNPADPAVDGAPAGLAVLPLWGPRTGAALITGLAALGVVLSVMLAAMRPVRGRCLGFLRRMLLALAVALGLVLAVAIPDYRLLAAVAYTPIVLVMTLVGAGPEGGPAWPWPEVNLALLTLGGLAWLATAVAHHRRMTRACGACGRGPSVGWRTPEAATRWGRWATAAAVAVPVGYAATRISWALGIPLGVDDDFLDELGGMAWAGAGLGGLALGGAVLTLGLVQRWGEVFPRWMPRLRGRTVPVGLAVVPASIVSLVVASAGVMFVRFVVTGRFGEVFPGGDDDVAAWLPEMFWPLWAGALAAATYAYWLRRRPAACAACGSGPRLDRTG